MGESVLLVNDGYASTQRSGTKFRRQTGLNSVSAFLLSVEERRKRTGEDESKSCIREGWLGFPDLIGGIYKSSVDVFCIMWFHNRIHDYWHLLVSSSLLHTTTFSWMHMMNLRQKIHVWIRIGLYSSAFIFRFDGFKAIEFALQINCKYWGHLFTSYSLIFDVPFYWGKAVNAIKRSLVINIAVLRVFFKVEEKGEKQKILCWGKGKNSNF